LPNNTTNTPRGTEEMVIEVPEYIKHFTEKYFGYPGSGKPDLIDLRFV